MPKKPKPIQPQRTFFFLLLPLDQFCVSLSLHHSSSSARLAVIAKLVVHTRIRLDLLRVFSFFTLMPKWVFFIFFLLPLSPRSQEVEHMWSWAARKKKSWENLAEWGGKKRAAKKELVQLKSINQHLIHDYPINKSAFSSPMDESLSRV